MIRAYLRQPGREEKAAMHRNLTQRSRGTVAALPQSLTEPSEEGWKWLADNVKLLVWIANRCRGIEHLNMSWDEKISWLLGSAIYSVSKWKDKSGSTRSGFLVRGVRRRLRNEMRRMKFFKAGRGSTGVGVCQPLDPILFGDMIPEAHYVAEKDSDDNLGSKAFEAFARLTEWQQVAIGFHLGLDGDPPMTTYQIADHMGCSHQNVSQAINDGLRKAKAIYFGTYVEKRGRPRKVKK